MRLIVATIFSLLLLVRPALANAENRCERIVSLAPSLTETLLALGLGHSLVGISRFCTVPAEFKTLPRIGGFLDPNYEVIVELHPTVVMLLSEFRERGDELRNLSQQTLIVDQRTVSGIKESITTIGAYCDKPEAAKALRDTLDLAVEEVQAKVTGLPKVRTLVVVGTEKIGGLKDLYVSGKDGFYDELVTLAGGTNVVKGDTKATTALSLEGIVALDPDVIIEIHPDYPDEAQGSLTALKVWGVFPSLTAVKNKRVHVLAAPYSYVPGPQFPKLLRAFAELLHPESR